MKWSTLLVLLPVIAACNGGDDQEDVAAEDSAIRSVSHQRRVKDCVSDYRIAAPPATSAFDIDQSADRAVRCLAVANERNLSRNYVMPTQCDPRHANGEDLLSPACMIPEDIILHDDYEALCSDAETQVGLAQGWFERVQDGPDVILAFVNDEAKRKYFFFKKACQVEHGYQLSRLVNTYVLGGNAIAPAVSPGTNAAGLPPYSKAIALAQPLCRGLVKPSEPEAKVDQCVADFTAFAWGLVEHPETMLPAAPPSP